MKLRFWRPYLGSIKRTEWDCDPPAPFGYAWKIGDNDAMKYLRKIVKRYEALHKG